MVVRFTTLVLVALVVAGFMAPAYGQLPATLYQQDFDFALATIGDDINTLPNDPNGTFYRPIPGPSSPIMTVSGTTIDFDRSAEVLGDGVEHTLAGFVFADAYPNGDAALLDGQFLRLRAVAQFTGTESKASIHVGQTQGGGPQYAAGWAIGFDFTGTNHDIRLNQRDPAGDAQVCGPCLGTNLVKDDVVEANFANTPFELQLQIFDDSSAKGYYRRTPGAGPWNQIGGPGALPMAGGGDLATQGADYSMLSGRTNGTVNFDTYLLELVVPEPATLLLLGVAAPLLLARRRRPALYPPLVRLMADSRSTRGKVSRQSQLLTPFFEDRAKMLRRHAIWVVALVVMGGVVPAYGQMTTTIFEEDFNGSTPLTDLNDLGWFDLDVTTGTEDVMVVSATEVFPGMGNSAEVQNALPPSIPATGSFPYHYHDIGPIVINPLSEEFFLRVFAIVQRKPLHLGTQAQSGGISLVNSNAPGNVLETGFTMGFGDFGAQQVFNGNDQGSGHDQTPIDVDLLLAAVEYQVEVDMDGTGRGYFRVCCDPSTPWIFAGMYNSFRGETDPVDFDTVVLKSGEAQFGGPYFDSIRVVLSETLIPEPTTLMLLGVALPLLACRRRGA